jgi:hypothetical protein
MIGEHEIVLGLLWWAGMFLLYAHGESGRDR